MIKNDRTGLNRRSLIASAAASVAASLFVPGLAAPALAQGMKKFRLLIATSPPDPGSHFLYYSQAAGMYAKHGLEVDIKTITVETTTLRAMIAGEGDVAAYVGANSTLQAMAAGSQLRCVSAFAAKLDYQILAETSIPDLTHLAGHTFGISQVGTVAQFVPSLMVKQAGGDVKGVRWVSAGNSSTRLQGMIAKTIDASAVNTPLAMRGLKYGYLHSIGDAAKALPDFVYTWEITTANTARNRPDELKAFVAANVDGIKWAHENTADAIAVSQQLLPDIDKDEVAAIVRSYLDRNFWPVDPRLTRQAWDFTSKAILDVGAVTSVPSYEEFVL